jgi:hypothetical protein
VFWGPRWRPGQKEPAGREAAARRGIEDFFSGPACLGHADVRRYSDDSSAQPMDTELLRLAAGVPPDRIVLIVVRELGPTLLLGPPAIVEGHTDVDIQVRVLDAKMSQPMAAVRTRWRDGGPLVVMGVGNPEQRYECRAALHPHGHRRATVSHRSGRTAPPRGLAALRGVSAPVVARTSGHWADPSGFVQIWYAADSAAG